MYMKHIFVLQCKDKGAFAVVVDSYVKEEEGTGVVHQAPYFGAVSMNYISNVNFVPTHTAWLSSYWGLSVRGTMILNNPHDIKQSSHLLLTNVRIQRSIVF